VVGGLGENYDPVFDTVVHRGDVSGVHAGGIIAGARTAEMNKVAQIGNVTGTGHAVGGLVASVVKLNINEGMAMGDVTVDTTTGDYFAATYAGGLVGGNMSSIYTVCSPAWPATTCPTFTESNSVTYNNDIDYNISNSWFGGHINATASEFAFSGGLVGAATDHKDESNLGQITIDNSYVVGTNNATGGSDYVYEGSVVGYSINDSDLNEIYVDLQELDEGRCAIANQGTCVATPAIGEDSYHNGVINLKTMNMTGSSKGIYGYTGDTMFYRGDEFSLTKDRADSNVEFVVTEEDTWRIPDEKIDSKLDVEVPQNDEERPFNLMSSIMEFVWGPKNTYAEKITEFYKVDTFYPRLAWIDEGLKAQPVAELSREINPTPVEPDIPNVPNTGILTAISGFGAIALAAIAFLIIKRRKNQKAEELSELD
ncbi:MAG: hypothetical protein LBM09_03130, partial [Candidatus Nomurabacteria bacterium]|nr:hypothetical protein [Candidatus Nomurabacteria bacterium]